MNFPPDWDDVTCISHMQRKILFCSISYYHFDESPIDDYVYDCWSHALARMMKECPDVAESRYYYVFYDFEGSTGYHLYSRLTEEDKYFFIRNIQIYREEKHLV